MLNEDTKQKEEKLEIYIPNGPRLGDDTPHRVKYRKLVAD